MDFPNVLSCLSFKIVSSESDMSDATVRPVEPEYSGIGYEPFASFRRDPKISIFINAITLEAFMAPYNQSELSIGEMRTIERLTQTTNIGHVKDGFVTRLTLSVQPLGRQLRYWGTSRPVYYLSQGMTGFEMLLRQFNWFYTWFDSEPRTNISASTAFFICYEYSEVESVYSTIGIATVHMNGGSPNIAIIDKCLVWPAVRGQGVGAKLIEAVYLEYASRNDVSYVTLNNPNMIMQRILRYVQAKLIEPLPEFSIDKLTFGLSKNMLEAASKTFKLCPIDSCIGYEILYYNCTEDEGPDRKDYEITVKKRLNLTLDEQMDNLITLFNGERKIVEWHNTELTEKTRVQLNGCFEALTPEYQAVANRLEGIAND